MLRLLILLLFGLEHCMWHSMTSDRQILQSFSLDMNRFCSISILQVCVCVCVASDALLFSLLKRNDGILGRFIAW